VPHDASQMYARNVAAFLTNLIDDGRVNLNLEDEIIRGTLLTHDGEIVAERVRVTLGLTTTESESG
jgi:NAD(P) transhydrogenase subunit alpha